MFPYYLEVKGINIFFFMLVSFYNLILKLKDYYLEIFYSHMERYIMLMIKKIANYWVLLGYFCNYNSVTEDSY